MSLSPYYRPHCRPATIMNEENEKTEPSPWDSLIGELGVDVSPEALERKQPAAQPLPTLVHERKQVAPEPAAPSDWAGLASSLGLEVPLEEAPPAKERPIVKEEPTARRTEKPRQESPREGRSPRQRDERPRGEADREDRGRGGRQRRGRGGEKRSQSDRDRGPRREEPAEVEDEILFEEVIEEAKVPVDFESESDDAGAAMTEQTVEEKEKPRISGEAARSAFDALFSADSVNWGSAFVSPRTNVESSFLFTEGEEAVFAEDIPDKTDLEGEEDELEDPEKLTRRRRRGGRGRGRGRRQESPEAQAEESEEGSDVAGEELSDELSHKFEPSERSEEDDERSDRRRRRRPRGRGRKPDGAEASLEDDPNVRRRIAAHVDGGDTDDDDDEDEVDGSEEGRSGHRNLPTWNDAIGVIVESNLSQRSKAPPRQQNSQRGGRGRGGRRHKKS